MVALPTLPNNLADIGHAIQLALAPVFLLTGIAGILNFAPTVLAVPEDVMVNNVNLAIELENLSYFIQS